jgi:transposase
MPEEVKSPPGPSPKCANCARLAARIAELEALVAQLEAKIKALEVRLGQTSRNSHKSPSSDPPDAPERPKKPPSGRKAGGQLGHEGKKRDLFPPEEVDDFIPYVPETCKHCNAPLPQEATPGDPAPVRYQVVDLPEKPLILVEYQLQARTSEQCGEITRGELPPEVASSNFGPRLTALAAFLMGACQLSKRQVEEIFEDVFGGPLALGTVVNMQNEASGALEATYQEAGKVVRDAPAKNLDETGWKYRSKNCWLWAAATSTVAYLVIHARRGADGLLALVGGVLRGIFTSDRWKVYGRRAKRFRQLCWAHLIRDFQKLIDSGGPGASIGERAKELAGELFMVWRDFKEGRIDRATLQGTLRPVRRQLRLLLEEGAKLVGEKVSVFSQNLLDLEPALWTFTHSEGVEPTNNHAERVLRQGVLWRKRSFGTQSQDGCRFVERILTVVQTCRLQRRRVYPFLVEAIKAYRKGQAAPSLVSA